MSAAAALWSLVWAGVAPWGFTQEADDGFAYGDDDECLADGGPEACALAAFQLRASRKAEEARRQLERQPAGSPPGFDDYDDEYDDADGADDVAEDDDEGPSDAGGGSASGGTAPAGKGELDSFDQCGGDGFSGVGKCKPTTVCFAQDEYYSLCVPESKLSKFKADAKKRKEREAAKEKAEQEEEDDSGYQEPLAKQKAIPPMSKTGSTPPVVVKGNFLYDSKTGNRFFAKGVAYNPRYWAFDKRLMKKGNCTPGDPPVAKLSYAADPTADELESTWKEALNAMAYMGANTVRLYNIDPEQSHRKFMDYAKSLGIYVIVPLTRHDWGFLPAGSPAPLCYTENITGYGNVGTNVLISSKLIVKEFSQYDNTLLFTVANEMTVADKEGYASFPCVKALTRDIHQYQKQCGATMRRVPLIYADMDMGPPYREVVGRYLSCELEGEDDAVDAYGLNVYSWCDSEYPDASGKDNFAYSPYKPIADEFKDFSKPLLFTEFGCNLGEFETFCPYKGGRTWPDVKTFFNQFKEIMSGAVAFEFSMEDNQYGLALSPGFTSDPKNADHFYYLDTFYELKKQFSKYKVSSLWDGAKIDSCSWTPSDAHKMAASHKPAACPTAKEVKALFKGKGLKAKPNWEKLPPTPEGADQDALSECPEYKVAEDIRKEACCHYKCSA